MTIDTREIDVQSQLPDVGEFVELLIVHTDEIDSSLTKLYVTPTQFTDQALVWSTQTFLPVDLETSGWEANAQGAMPTPSVKLSLASDPEDSSSTAGVIRAAIVQFSGLVGARVQRIRTLKKFLDGESEADPLAHYPIDEYRIERVVAFNRREIEWELSAIMDQEGKKLPGRQVLRDVCTHTYRIPDATEHEFTQRSCPYIDNDDDDPGKNNYFDRNGNVTTWDNDYCGRRISDCRLRFRLNANGTKTDPLTVDPDEGLPTRAFPGVSVHRCKRPR